MIWVLTAHHRSDRWIRIQRDALARTMRDPYRVVACLEGVDAACAAAFDDVLWLDGHHGPKLNALVEHVDAADDDLLVFLDGDAFPIADPMPYVRAALEDGATLVAVRRDEAHKQQPHPCFTAVPYGTWRQFGDWRPGQFDDIDGVPVVDVGGRLLGHVDPWAPLLRMTTHDLHPLFFAVYGADGMPLVYHHGAGFRTPVSRLDRRAGDVARRRDVNVWHSSMIHAAAAADPMFWARFVA